MLRKFIITLFLLTFLLPSLSPAQGTQHYLKLGKQYSNNSEHKKAYEV